MKLRLALLCLLAAMGMAVSAHAQTEYAADPFDPAVAREAWALISRAEKTYNIPAGLLHAISLVETGQGMRGWVLPWPYTIGVNAPGSRTVIGGAAALEQYQRWRALGFVRFNIKGAGINRTNIPAAETSALLGGIGASTALVMEARPYGRRFGSAKQAEAFATRMFASGHNNLDIGMMQINWRTHGKHFGSIGAVLEPRANLRYAVNYLLTHRQSRDWWGSVGRYHSATPVFARRYIRNVYTMYMRIHRANSNA